MRPGFLLLGWHFASDNSWEGSVCALQDTEGIPGFHPLDASSPSPPAPAMTTKNNSRLGRCPPGERTSGLGKGKVYPVHNILRNIHTHCSEAWVRWRAAGPLHAEGMCRGVGDVAGGGGSATLAITPVAALTRASKQHLRDINVFGLY